MKLKIRKAAVIGAGTMGAGIAAHLANCGIETLLLDIVPPELSEKDKANGLDASSPDFRNMFALKALKEMPKAKLAPLYDPKDVELIKAGNLEDDFDALKEVDWIVEVIVENIGIKQKLFERLESTHHDGQIVSSNTSGIALEKILEGRSKSFKEHCLITHFFNPPRYMYLLEIVPCQDTRPDLLEAMCEFGERVLGKGSVLGKDTPNFIANRVGGFDFTVGAKLAMELGLSIEETDLLCGTLIGRPKTALFRLLDLVGLDVAVHVNRNLYEAVPDDESREVFQPDPLIGKLVERGSLGDKVREGFYKKTKGEDGATVILALDPETLEYRPAEKPKLDGVKEAKKLGGLDERLRFLAEREDKVGQFVWRLLSSTICYAANRIPEITSEVHRVDDAMKWGYAWDIGPFEIWDALGVRSVVERLEKDGREVPALVKEMLDAGCENFYGFSKDCPTCYDPADKKMKPLPRKPWALSIADQRKSGKTILEGKSASIIDLEDGVICLEMHSKVNAIGAEVVEMIHKAIEEAENNHLALVIAGRGPNFSVGADLSEGMASVMNGKWWVFEDMIKSFQEATSALSYSHIPTVAAVHGRALGGGCEIPMHCDRIQASPELYIGLVEIGVGLVPGGGGCREWTIRCGEMADATGGDLFPRVNNALLQIGMANVSRSAANAKQLGYLRAADGVSRNRESLIRDAKLAALQLAEQGYRPPTRRKCVRVLGESGIAEFKVRLNIFRQSGNISEYDEFLANKVACILCGGDLPANSLVDEEYLLDLERETFVTLLGNPKSQARIMHTLKTGKPLRN